MMTHRALQGMKILVLLLMLGLAVPGRAQLGNEGSIEGTVIDASGAVIPGVMLCVKNASTSDTFYTTTNELGMFRFPVLPVGSYELVAEHPGFASLIQKNVVVSIGAEINLTLTLLLATGREKVVVSGETPLLESTRSQVSTTLDARSVANLPLNGRTFLGFVFLTPGVTPGVTPAASGVSVTFGGQRGMSSFLLDGADDNNTFQSGPLGGLAGSDRYQLSQEAVQEFQVNTNAYSVELGRAGAGVVSVITKSGTNEFHGSLFWYFRDRALNATGLISKNLGEPKESLHVHQFGGAVGGPIRRIPSSPAFSTMLSITCRQGRSPGFAALTKMSTWPRLTGTLLPPSDSAGGGIANGLAEVTLTRQVRRSLSSAPGLRRKTVTRWHFHSPLRSRFCW